jgi:alkyldihydroxyacetonephosphate synthase
MVSLSQPELLSRLAAIVGPRGVSAATPDRIAYGADFWPKTQIWKQLGDVDRFPPDCVVWPTSPAEVAAVLALCNDHGVPIVARGGGSGVCGGTIPVHGGVVLDLKRMRRIRAVDHDSLTIEAEAGLNGQHLEDHLNHLGLSLGHFPSSIMCSTLGGWLAARSGGQFSSRYGKIEDMVQSLEVVLPDGTTLDTRHRSPGAPDWTQVLVGSEGTLGVITAAVLKVHPKPAARTLRGLRFRQLKDALRAMRAVMQAGLRPMVLRLYDPFDSLIALGKEPPPQPDPESDEPPPGKLRLLAGQLAARSRQHLMDAVAPLGRALKRTALVSALSTPPIVNRIAGNLPAPCLLIIGFEGEPDFVSAELAGAMRVLADHGAVDLGAAPGEAWLARRYAVGFKQTKMFELGAFVDTMEVATTWDRLQALHDAVRTALTPHAFVMAHFSHAYREGCSIYFTFGAHKGDPQRAERHYERCWEAATDAVLSAGGTLSHHHGVGLAKRSGMVREHGAMLRVGRALKQTLDPRGIMNPGKLWPDDDDRTGGGRGEGERAAREGVSL